ncbi:NADP-dependent isocitrate dehydrogenase [Ignavibacterium sp.]|uniref:NADP-dependent isocitrate dehydrogenase n=1 Tax=Ignavibacterium sp. TaxID=2651167 RepID=UPI00329982EB
MRYYFLKKHFPKNCFIIFNNLIEVQGKPVDIGGYYLPDDNKATGVMRPSELFNRIVDGM